MTTSHKTKWREARMRLKNRDVMTIFNRDGTTTEVEHPFSALQALHYEQQIDIDKIKKALLIAYIGDVGCTLSNEDCNDLTKYISRLEGDNEALKQRADWAVNHIKEADESMRVFTGDDAE